MARRNKKNSQDPIKESLLRKSISAKKDMFGRSLSLSALILIGVVVFSIFFFVLSRGLMAFTLDRINPLKFIFGTVWNPTTPDSNGNLQFGAFPMIVGSFLVTLLSALVATPFAIATALFMVELQSNWGKKIMQPVVELLVGIPSVVYGFIGLTVVVPFLRKTFGGSGFGILAGTIVLFVMILPTITSLTVDALRNVPNHYRESALAIGATRWQMIYKVILRAATPGILTAVVFGMARAFGEALAVQMVVGNAPIMPNGLLESASTLTSILTQGIGNTSDGSVQNDVLWTLAMLLLIMSLFFNLIIRFIGKRTNITQAGH
ncbi:phosphate ABC transporter permease subunit PstC [Oenococcus oeni]|uniref:phosphate ABC transporter permease subunit PstC n=1 Tax=Oenococcus oeni TaxID=1247 RepID=UPI00050E2480|nr:phosphate ABC transporter permease subunit PstC [Oenococcus oeni]KGH73630.1 phosphate ABC transporter permease [Oenococcus oeni IOEB_0502]